MRRMPSLKALRAFEAAARHSSVSAAGRELNVSHSAISQQISILEGYFGRPLFLRRGKRIAPTAEAAAFLEDIRLGFDRIAMASEQFARSGGARVVTINTTPSFAMRWLIPRLPGFQSAHPEIEVRVSTSSTDQIAGLGEPYDIIIRRDAMNRADHRCDRFLDDVATVVVARNLVEKGALKVPKDLLGLPLLQMRSRPEAWPRWFELNGVSCPDPLAGPLFEHFFLSVQAAINGLGAAVVPYALVESDLAAGILAAPFSSRDLVGPGFHILYRTDFLTNRVGRTIVDWLLAEGRGHKPPSGSPPVPPA